MLIQTSLYEPTVDDLNKSPNNTAIIFYYQHDDCYAMWLKLNNGGLVHESIPNEILNLSNNDRYQIRYNQQGKSYLDNLEANSRRQFNDYVTYRMWLYNNNKSIALIDAQYSSSCNNEWVCVRDDRVVVDALKLLEEKYLNQQKLSSRDFVEAHDKIRRAMAQPYFHDFESYEGADYKARYAEVLNNILNRLVYLAAYPGDVSNYQLLFIRPGNPYYSESARIYDPRLFSAAEAKAHDFHSLRSDTVNKLSR